MQSASGKVSPNRRGTLPGVSVDKASFTLAPGAEQAVTATLNSAPSAGYLYGAIEAVGVPTDLSKRKGVVLGYRLVGALRITPATPKTGLTAGTAKAVKGTAVVPVKNTGNTLDAVSGTVRVKSSGGHEADLARGDQDPARQVDQRAARLEARQGLLHRHAVAQAARQDGADGDEEVQGQMRNLQSRPIRSAGGYARRGSVGALTTVWVGRSDSGSRVLGPSVVKMKILEGKQ